eukprot:720955-Pyramimonas_sp.AAC.1
MSVEPIAREGGEHIPGAGTNRMRGRRANTRHRNQSHEREESIYPAPEPIAREGGEHIPRCCWGR